MNTENLWRLSAIAAGVSVPIAGYHPDHCNWDPLNKNDDAMKMAVLLGLRIDCMPETLPNACVTVTKSDYSLRTAGGVEHRAFEPYRRDAQAAIRLAIVRVAAKIGGRNNYQSAE